MTELPKGWAIEQLGRIAEINPTQPTAPVEDRDLVSFIPMAKVQPENGLIDKPDLRPWGEVKKGYTRFQDGDLLFAKITPCMENGKIAIAKELRGGVGAGSTEFHVIRPLHGFRAEYLFYFLSQREVRRNARVEMKGAAGQLRVPPSFLEHLQLPIAPTFEQDRIVAEIEKQFTRLDSATAALERVQTNLKRYHAAVLKAACKGRLVPTEAELARREGREYEPADKLLERILRERRARWEADTLAKITACGTPPNDDRWRQKYKEPASPNTSNLSTLPEGWCWATLGQLTSLITSGSRGWGDLYSESGPLFIRAQDIRTDSLMLKDVAHVQLPHQVEGSRTRVQKSDLLVTITGANVTKTALVGLELEQAYVSQHVGLVRPVLGESSDYLYSWIVSPMNGRAELLRLAYGAGKPGLNLDNLRELCVALPPVAEQQRIQTETSRIISSVMSLKSNIDVASRHASGLRNSILQVAFTGKLVPQNPTDEPASVLLERIRNERADSKPKPPTHRRPELVEVG